MMKDAEQSLDNEPGLSAPHRDIQTNDARERFTLELFDALWIRYRERVSYVQQYEQMIERLGGTFVNDHIAFRTLGCQRPATGIASLSRIFKALGYSPACCYHFPDKHLDAVHFQHPHEQFPKLFVSELRAWELPKKARNVIAGAVKTHRRNFGDSALRGLLEIDRQTPEARRRLLKRTVDWFHRLPWKAPRKRDLVALNQDSQYGAWVLAHGYNVNHFTALINSQGVAELDSIDKTVERLLAEGTPMKSAIEGEVGSKLRQTATEAVVIDVPVRSGKKLGKTEWTYAYLELAERGTIPD
ncbi:MAG: DUF1338 domain-containing protein [Planctomycetales bacterium]